MTLKNTAHVAAIGAAVVAASFATETMAGGHGIDLTPSGRMVAQSLLAALLVGMVASIPPAIAVARRPLSLSVKAD